MNVEIVDGYFFKHQNLHHSREYMKSKVSEVEALDLSQPKLV